ncbi:MAG TPA: thioredoxin domain-containing protein [Candidatus Ozemobacteraceae bacterium]|nr:thioredoxin domain-containing protein [Candidatus Ozemobacteraceae bacterium]
MIQLPRLIVVAVVTLLMALHLSQGSSSCLCGSPAFAQASESAPVVEVPLTASATAPQPSAVVPTTQPASDPGKVAGVASESAAGSATATPAVVRGPLPKMVDLGAGKCNACKKMEPVLEEAKRLYEGKADVIFIDVWKDRDAGSTYGIRMIPTQIFFDANGKEVYRHEGFLPLEDIRKQFESLGVVLLKE